MFDVTGHEPRKDRDLKMVGPGNYNPSLADKKREPAFSMGAKVQTENTKLNVPGAGSYNPPSKVSQSHPQISLKSIVTLTVAHPSLLFLYSSLRAQARAWVPSMKSKRSRASSDPAPAVIPSTSKRLRTTATRK